MEELFGQQHPRHRAAVMAIVLGLASALENTITFVVEVWRVGRFSASTSGVRRGWRPAIVLPVRGSCAPPGGRISTLGVGIRTSAASCAQNGAARATLPPQ